MKLTNYLNQSASLYRNQTQGEINEHAKEQGFQQQKMNQFIEFILL